MKGIMRFSALCLVLILALDAAIYVQGRKEAAIPMGEADPNLRPMIVKLHSAHGSCTGVEIEGPSHKLYVLTAAHCRSLVVDGRVLAENDAGENSSLEFIAEDPKSDLMLLGHTVGAKKGIKIADKASVGDLVHTLTRGHGMPTYRTDGVIMGQDLAQFLVGEINTNEEMAACKQPKNAIVEGFFGLFCIYSGLETATTATVIPGSSGGALLNLQGELIGIASCGGEGIYLFVRLEDIQAFMAGR